MRTQFRNTRTLSLVRRILTTLPPQQADIRVDGGLLYQDIDVVDSGMPELFDNCTKNNTIPDVAGGILWVDDVNEIL